MLAFGDDPILAYQGFSRELWKWARLECHYSKDDSLYPHGLSVAVAFKAGLFNIGASGQFVMGSVCSVAIGIHFEGTPNDRSSPSGNFEWDAGRNDLGAIPGLLKVTTGAHEVIVTIMMNYLASLFAGWTVYAGEHKVKLLAHFGIGLRGQFQKHQMF